MKNKEKLFVYKPSTLRVITENIIGFFVALISVIMLNKSASTGIENLIGAVSFFVVVFIHNYFLFKPALQKQEWIKYILKLIICLLLIFPLIFTIDDIIKYLFFEKALPNFQATYKNLVSGSAIIVFVGGVIYLVKYYAMERQLRLQSELQLKKKQLLLLQSQINPHFLFNALNSIKSLTNSDPERARDAIVSLSGLLRKSLNTTTDIFIKIDDEIATVYEYLALEKLRYGDRLTFDIKVEYESTNALVPSMSLQLMVENAIKHGINKLMDGGKIDIHIYEKENKLYIDVRNPGQIAINKLERGIGTQNIIENLKILYGDAGHFCIINENSQTVLAQLITPIKYN